MLFATTDMDLYVSKHLLWDKLKTTELGICGALIILHNGDRGESSYKETSNMGYKCSFNPET